MELYTNLIDLWCDDHDDDDTFYFTGNSCVRLSDQVQGRSPIGGSARCHHSCV